MHLTESHAMARLIKTLRPTVNIRCRSRHKESLMIMVNEKFEKLPSNREDKSTRKDEARVLRDDELDAVTGGGGGGDQTQLPDLEGGHTTYKKV
jgi:hypothetical protein